MELAPDQIKHIIAGLTIYIVAALFLGIWGALAITIAVGLAKEYIVDKYIINGTVEFMDFVATATIPLIVTLIWELLF